MNLRHILPALLAVAALMLMAACTDSEAAPDLSTATPDPPATEAVLAPIELAEVAVAESAPPQYYLQVVSGLPGGCARFDRYEVQRTGDVITVTVWNRMPSAPVACTMIYGYVNHSVPLGANFESGHTYTVHINNMTIAFTAQ